MAPLMAPFQFVPREHYLEIQVTGHSVGSGETGEEADMLYRLQIVNEVPVIEFQSRTNPGRYLIHLNLPYLFGLGNNAWIMTPAITLYLVWIATQSVTHISKVQLSKNDSERVRACKLAQMDMTVEMVEACVDYLYSNSSESIFE